MGCGSGKPGAIEHENGDLGRPLNPPAPTSVDVEDNHARPQPRGLESPPSSPMLSPSSKRVLRKGKTLEDLEATERDRSLHSSKHMASVRHSSSHRWTILVCTAIFSGALSFGIDTFTFHFGLWRTQLSFGNESLPIVILINVSAMMLARLINRTCIESEGSGFPEMKAMLFGKALLNFLTLKALVCKCCSLSLAVGAGLPVGKEGPNVHMAACISRALAPEVYEPAPVGIVQTGRARHLKTLRAKNLLLAATSVAVGSSFGAPIGGVIFALELMLPQIYDTMAYWGCFVSSVAGALCYTILRTVSGGSLVLLPLLSTNVLPGEGATSARPVTRLLLDLLLGCICGLLGGLWIQAHAKVGGIMKRWRTKASAVVAQSSSGLPASPIGASLGTALFAKTVAAADATSWTSVCGQWRDLFQVAVVVALNTILAAKLPLFAGKPQPILLSSLFDKNLIIDSDQWSLEYIGPLGTMFLCFLMKAAMTILALTIPISAGAVAPLMIIGALVGRVYGLLLPDFLLDFLLSSPGSTEAITDAERGALMARFAIIGAAAYSTAVCRAFAMAITVYEVLTLPSTLLPLCSACLAAIFVANKVSIPFFDMNLKGRGLGGISELTQGEHAYKSARSVMRILESDADCLHLENCTIGEMRDLLDRTKGEDFSHIPIMQNVPCSWAKDGTAAPMLKGSITRENLEMVASEGHPQKEINLLDAYYTVPQDIANDETTEIPLVIVNPPHITPDSFVSDVYIIFKATDTEAVFVIDQNCLAGVITYKELLGHRLDKPWFG